MKTLQQIEPRTDLAAVAGEADYHHVITTAGSYYLTGNLDVTRTNGIDVRVEGVTLDLNGFEIGRTAGAGGNGIEVDATAHRCTIKNGSLKGFAYGLQCVGPTLNFARGGRCLHLSVSGCSESGLFAGEGWQLDGCTAHDNTGDNGSRGISAGSGSTLTNCSAVNNVGTGIFVNSGSTLTNCSAVANTGSNGIFASRGSTLTNCSASSNTVFFGIYTYEGCTLKNCAALSNIGSATTSGGIFTGDGCTLIGCSARSNTNTNATDAPEAGFGIRIGTGSTVRDCTSEDNEGSGIQVGFKCHIVGNTCTSNTTGGEGAGIHLTGPINACRIDGNHCVGGTRGIWVQGTDNLIVRNSVQGTTLQGYGIVAGNHSAEIISSPGLSFASTSPWANFRF
ncbi:MAG: right-handed parallel beta-helix repeat-containing protein [Verrucomicrobiales bacterium]